MTAARKVDISYYISSSQHICSVSTFPEQGPGHSPHVVVVVVIGVVAGVAGAVVAAALVGVGPRQAGGRQHQYQKYGIHCLQYFVKRGANKRKMLSWYAKHYPELLSSLSKFAYISSV